MKSIDQPERNRTTRWAIRLDPNYTVAYGCDELHSVFLTPTEDVGGPRGAVVVQIPETPDALFVTAMEVAIQSRARVVFVCDTAAQSLRGRAQSREDASKPLPRLDGAGPGGRLGSAAMTTHLDADLEYFDAPPRHPSPGSCDEAIDFLEQLRPGAPWALSAIATDGPIETITVLAASDIWAFVAPTQKRYMQRRVARFFQRRNHRQWCSDLEYIGY